MGNLNVLVSISARIFGLVLLFCMYYTNEASKFLLKLANVFLDKLRGGAVGISFNLVFGLSCLCLHY